MFIKADIYFKTVHLSSKMYDAIAIEVQCYNRKVNIITLYRPPGQDSRAYLAYLEYLIASLNNTIILTDSNIDLLESSSPICKSFNELLVSYNCQLLNTIAPEHATRITSTSATIIDQAFTTLRNCESLLQITDCCFSDHRMLTTSIEIPLKLKTTTTEKSFKKINRSLFFALVKHELDIRSQLEMETSMELLIAIIKNCKDASTSITTKKVRNKSLPWISLSILKEIKNREKLRKREKSEPNGIAANGCSWTDLYNFSKLKIRKMIAEAKQKHLEKGVLNAHNNPRKMWATINEHLGVSNKRKVNEPIKEIKTESGDALTNPKQIANYLNSFFNNLSSTPGHPRVLNQRCQQSIFWTPVTVNEVIIAIAELKSDSAPGIDSITVKDIKALTDLIAPVLTKLFNQYMADGLFPDCLKEAIVKPIFKKGEKDKPGNYRPISLLPVFGKLFEKIINSRLVAFINQTSQFDNNQFGFLSKSSTESAVLQTCLEINKKLDEGKYVISVFVDLKKAFDMVNHQILLEVLEELGVRGISLELMKNYITNRHVKMKVGDDISNMATPNSGVPQGSVLGPLLYLLYINNIRQVGLKAKYTIYADDTSLIYSGTSLQELQATVNEDLQLFHNWLSGNGLVLNVSKTVYMLFKQKNKKEIQPNIEINNSPIQRVSNTKYLGMVVDDKLSWENHVDLICGQINPMIGAIRRCSKFTPHLVKTIYDSYILSKAVYNIPIWSQCAKKLTEKVSISLTRSLKALLKLPWDTRTKNVYRMSQAKPLCAMIKVTKCKLIYKIKKKLIKSNETVQTSGEVAPHFLRSHNNYRLLRNRTNRIKNGFMNSAAILFNTLPTVIKTESNPYKFYDMIKKHFK